MYDITKSLFENQPELATAHAKGAELKLDEAVDGISIPLHPGAEKYFKETGILK
ncbi:TAXI family TRAP transporter solute-binding subunit [Sedimentibacter sp.]|uniref:TAXI family TRAP transporter solute-binding subunit n=1 Tax=Sedimentibacter sp. TaxID=1960295 RepID=UPI0028AECEC6|nr:TAXI family TRAP transporter solute-binding subunit [Sedimentibacter sp.]